jgi:hypothetical protein
MGIRAVFVGNGAIEIIQAVMHNFAWDRVLVDGVTTSGSSRR